MSKELIKNVLNDVEKERKLNKEFSLDNKNDTYNVIKNRVIKNFVEKIIKSVSKKGSPEMSAYEKHRIEEVIKNFFENENNTLSNNLNKLKYNMNEIISRVYNTIEPKSNNTITFTDESINTICSKIKQDDIICSVDDSIYDIDKYSNTFCNRYSKIRQWFTTDISYLLNVYANKIKKVDRDEAEQQVLNDINKYLQDGFNAHYDTSNNVLVRYENPFELTVDMLYNYKPNKEKDKAVKDLIKIYSSNENKGSNFIVKDKNFPDAQNQEISQPEDENSWADISVDENTGAVIETSRQMEPEQNVTSTTDEHDKNAKAVSSKTSTQVLQPRLSKSMVFTRKGKNTEDIAKTSKKKTQPNHNKQGKEIKPNIKNEEKYSDLNSYIPEQDISKQSSNNTEQFFPQRTPTPYPDTQYAIQYQKVPQANENNAYGYDNTNSHNSYNTYDKKHQENPEHNAHLYNGYYRYGQNYYTNSENHQYSDQRQYNSPYYNKY